MLGKFAAGYRDLVAKGLPDALGLQQSFVNTPSGKAFTALFVWSSDDLDWGYHWLQQVARLGEVVHNSVVPRSIQDWLDDSGAFVPKSAYGGDCTISIRAFTDEVIAAVGAHIAAMPTDPATLFSVHELRGTSASPRAGSVFGARTPHYVFEFIATSSSQGEARHAWKWATEFRDAVKEAARDNVADFTYISLTPPGEADCAAIYGPRWERLVEIKQRYDPENVFRHAMPQFGSVGQ